MRTLLSLLPLPAALAFLAGCAALIPGRNSLLGPGTVEMRGDTAVYRGHYRTGGIRSEVTLVRGKREDSTLLFFPDGTLQYAGRFQGGMAEGEAITYFHGGKRSRVEFHERDTVQVHRTREFDSTGARNPNGCRREIPSPGP